MLKIKKSRKDLLKEIEILKNNNKVLSERNVDLNRRGILYQVENKELKQIIDNLKKEMKTLKCKLTKATKEK